MIKVHPATLIASRWIGVDLNTTGHVAVAADILSGKTMKLGKNIHYNHRQSSKNCTKFWKEGKLWKLKKVKSRERKTFKSALNAISRQIVSFAESLGSGHQVRKNSSPRAIRTATARRARLNSRSTTDRSLRSSSRSRSGRSTGAFRSSMSTRRTPRSAAAGAAGSAGAPGSTSSARTAGTWRTQT